MDFIERMFGISPDGGNGSVEELYLAAVAAALALFGYAFYRRCARRNPSVHSRNTPRKPGF